MPEGLKAQPKKPSVPLSVRPCEKRSDAVDKILRKFVRQDQLKIPVSILKRPCEHK